MNSFFSCRKSKLLNYHLAVIVNKMDTLVTKVSNRPVSTTYFVYRSNVKAAVIKYRLSIISVNVYKFVALIDKFLYSNKSKIPPNAFQRLFSAQMYCIIMA